MQDYKDDGVKFAMTTKGIWYCSELNIHTDDINKALQTADTSMGKINRILGVRNRYAKKKTDK